MSISTTNLSHQALLAGIVAIADTIGPNCHAKMSNAIVQAQRRFVAPVDAPLDLRDLFAGQALMAIVGNDRLLMDFVKVGEAAGARLGETVAHAAYEFADEMLSARGAA